MPTSLTEGVDYEIENGRWVFTERFLRARGTCCGSGCRHCPYSEARREPEERPRPDGLESDAQARFR